MHDGSNEKSPNRLVTVTSLMRTEPSHNHGGTFFKSALARLADFPPETHSLLEGKEECIGVSAESAELFLQVASTVEGWNETSAEEDGPEHPIEAEVVEWSRCDFCGELSEPGETDGDAPFSEPNPWQHEKGCEWLAHEKQEVLARRKANPRTKCRILYGLLDESPSRQWLFEVDGKRSALGGLVPGMLRDRDPTAPDELLVEAAKKASTKLGLRMGTVTIRRASGKTSKHRVAIS